MESAGGRGANDDRRLRWEYDNLPKVPRHGEEVPTRHSDLRPEWIMRVINDPYDEWDEVALDGVTFKLFAGRVEQCQQWIRVVFVEREDGYRELLTAYVDRRLQRKYGGRPWQS